MGIAKVAAARTMMAALAEVRDVWLRGNARVAMGLAILAISLGGAAGAAAWQSTTAWSWWIVAAVCGSLALAAVGMAWAARQPRLVRCGDTVLVRVSPVAWQAVPVDVVECFFPGSNPLDAAGAPTCGEHAAFRVGTVVMRLAERATDYQARETFAPWVTWDDGYVVIDGRWCEPLSPALAKELGGKLVAAKRDRQGSCG